MWFYWKSIHQHDFSWAAGKKYLILFCIFLSLIMISQPDFIALVKLSNVAVILVRANIRFFLVTISLHANIFPITSLGIVKLAHMVCLCTSVVITLAMTLSEISHWISVRNVGSAAGACRENSPILLSLPSVPHVLRMNSKCEYWELLNFCQREHSRRQYLQSVKGNQ